MPDERLTQARSLLDAAERELNRLRLETPADYFSTPEKHDEVTAQMRKIDEEKLNRASVLLNATIGEVPEDEYNEVADWFGQVNWMFDYVSEQKGAGRLPELKEAPWPPSQLAMMIAMREDAADAAAEPGTNGYEEATNG